MRLVLLVVAVLAGATAARAEEPAPASPPPSLSAPPPAAAPPAPGAPAPVVVAEAPAPAAAPKAKHGIFPLWGDKVRAKGFDLPNPYSVMFNYYYQSSELAIDNLQLGYNGGPKRNFDALVQIPNAKAVGSALSVRPAVMILPFFSVYGVFSSGSSRTNVTVQSPILAQPFDTVAKSGVQVFALGGTFQMGYKGVFGVADFNAAVSDVDRLADLVGANMLSFRLGYSHKLNDEGRKIAGWIGTAGQVIDVNTEGSVGLNTVLPGIDGSRCPTFPPSLAAQCQELVTQIQNGATVDYKLDKKPKDVWNLLAGVQYALDRTWAFRFEASFLGSRYSFFGGAAYEFDIY